MSAAAAEGFTYWTGPLTSAEHEGAAKKFVQEGYDALHGTEGYRVWCMGVAQVHATLAVAAATREAGDPPDLRAP